MVALGCVCGCEELLIDEKARTMTIRSSGKIVNEGDVISINGNTGEVIGVEIETSNISVMDSFGTVLGWAGEIPTP